MSKTKFKFFIILLMIVAIYLLSFKNEYDSLHKRNFYTSLSETKNGQIAKKVINDQLHFKNGKLFSDFLHRKFNYKWIRYRINKDSVFVDSTGTEVRLLLVEALATDENNQTVSVNFSTQEWDLDGEIKITKNDKLKRHYTLSGREKGGKPKRQKAFPDTKIEVN